MEITICDFCKRQPDTDLQIVTLYRFEAQEKWWHFRPKTKTLCLDCMDKIFAPKSQ